MSRVHHAINTFRYLCLRSSQYFSKDSFEAIPLVSLTEFSRCGQTKATVVQTVRENEQHKTMRYSLRPGFINSSEVCRCSEPKMFWESICRSVPRHKIQRNLIVFNRDALTPLIPSGFQHQTTSTSSHAFAKTVGFRASSIVRLKGPLWHFCAPRKTLNLT